MKVHPAVLWAALCCLLVLPARAQQQDQPNPFAGNPFVRLEALIQDEHSAEPAGPTLTLDQIEQMALLRNPEIAVAVRRVVTAESRVPAAGALDDPKAVYRGWGVPLSQPWNFNAAQNMFMLNQALPGPGKRALRSSVAESDVDEAKDRLANTRLQVRVQVRRAFYDLLLAQDELKIHDEHVAIARQAIQAARIRYTVGQVPQQDLLKAQLELTRLAEHLIRFERDAAIARARLNTLIGREPATPIRVTGRYGVLGILPSQFVLEKEALQSRPDLLEAQAAEEKSRREQRLAKKAYVPDFTVSGGYMLMAPTANMRNTYMVEGSMSLPWLNHRLNNAKISEASAEVAEQDATVTAIRSVAFGQIQEALAEAQAAQRFAALYQQALRPQAEATLHAAVIAYENNQTDFLNLLDSQEAVIDIDLNWLQALADFNTRMADLELAVGAPVQLSQPQASASAKENK
jgi:outer membrane protein TolC